MKSAVIFPLGVSLGKGMGPAWSAVTSSPAQAYFYSHIGAIGGDSAMWMKPLEPGGSTQARRDVDLDFRQAGLGSVVHFWASSGAAAEHRCLAGLGCVQYGVHPSGQLIAFES